MAKAAKFLGLEGLPKFHIQWNANGVILKKPTIFGFAGGRFQGGGEAGPEAVLPIDRLSDFINNGMRQFLNDIPTIDEDRLALKIADATANRPVSIVVDKRELARI